MELHLLHCARSLLNAVNHGKATMSVIVTLSSADDRLKLTVQDNGSGFELSDKGRAGMGIRIMRYRAKVIAHFGFAEPERAGDADRVRL